MADPDAEPILSASQHKPAITQRFNFLGLSAFQWFKYGIYLLLSYNLYLFILEDYGAIAEAYPQGVTPLNFVEVFSASIDTAAWVILLIIFELETAVLSDDRLRSWQGYALSTVKVVCYGFISYAFYGYLSKYTSVTSLSPAPFSDACQTAASGWAYIHSLNEYFPITAQNCAGLTGPLQMLQDTQIIGTDESVKLIHNLALVDVLNAGAWILVVALLQAEVILQLRQALTERIMFFSKIAKGFFYIVLLSAAIYWGIDGSFLDFWDAFLWLIAFIFIDLNLFEWHEEVQDQAADV